ncbi:NAD(P)/FAD-dependent oxidoreductase [Enterococcus sp. LJL90]
MEDVIIIGGGPAGLYSAFYCGMRGLSVKLIEGSSQLGGKLNFYHERIIWDLGGVEPRPAKEVVAALREQAATFPTKVLLNQAAVALKQQAEHWQVITKEGQVHEAKAVIVATGTGMVAKQPVIWGDAQAPQIDYKLAAGERYQDQTVLLYGSFAKVKRALKKLTVAKKVIVFGAEEKFPAEFTNLQVIPEPLRVTVKETENQLAVTLTFPGENFQPLLVDCLVAFQQVNHAHPLKSELSKRFDISEFGQVTTSGQGKTELAGLFAVGDASQYEGKMNMIAGAIYEGLQTANQIAVYLNDEAEPVGKVSTHHPELLKKL